MSNLDPTRTSPPDFKYTPSADLSESSRLVLNKVMEMGERYVNNLMLSRETFMRTRTDKRRDIAAECGHPPTGEVTIDMYRELYDRNPVAARVVEVYPRECWGVQPTVYESEDVEDETAFEKAWKEMGQSFQTEEEDYFQDEQGSVIWSYLKQVDELAGIGRYGVLLLGLADGSMDLSQPAQMRKPDGRTRASGRTPAGQLGAYPTPSSSLPPTISFNASRPSTSLAYLRAFPEYLADVVSLESNHSSPRYGQPTLYKLTVNDPRNMQPGTVRGGQSQTIDVHWTRVIHVADTHHTASSSEWFAVPRMRPILNRLLDLDKLYGSSAEMYWLGAFPGLAFKAIAEEGMAPAVNDPMLRSEIENYMHGLQRFLRLVNIDVEPIAPQVVDPTAQIERGLEALSIKLAVPKRIFVGSERGELSSSQDDATWNDRKKERQDSWITPRLIRPFINRLIALGVLPAPKGYSVKWPDLSSQTATEKSDVAFKFSQALSQYADSQAGLLLTPVDFLTKIIGMDEQEALKATENAEEHARQAQEEMAAQQQQQMADQQAGQQTDTHDWVRKVVGLPPVNGGPPGASGSGPPGAPGGPPGSQPPNGQPGLPVPPGGLTAPLKGTLPGKPGVTRPSPIKPGLRKKGGSKGKRPFDGARNAAYSMSPLTINLFDPLTQNHVPLTVVNASQGDGHWITMEGGQHVFIGGGGGGKGDFKPGGPGGRSVDTGKGSGGTSPSLARGGKGAGSTGGGTKGAGKGGKDKDALKKDVADRIKAAAATTASGGKHSDKDVADLKASLSKLTVPDLKALNKEHGQKVSGLKAELVDRLAARLTEKLTAEKGQKDKTEEAKTPKGAKEQAKRDADDIINRLKEGKGKPEDADNLKATLGKMTGKELDALKKEHGLKASGKNKEELANKLADRLTEKFTAEKQDKKDGKTPDKAPDRQPDQKQKDTPKAETPKPEAPKVETPKPEAPKPEVKKQTDEEFARSTVERLKAEVKKGGAYETPDEAAASMSSEQRAQVAKGLGLPKDFPHDDHEMMAGALRVARDGHDPKKMWEGMKDIHAERKDEADRAMRARSREAETRAREQREAASGRAETSPLTHTGEAANRKLDDQVNKALGNKDLTPAHRASYEKSLRDTLANMPQGARDRVATHLDEVVLAKDKQQSTKNMSKDVVDNCVKHPVLDREIDEHAGTLPWKERKEFLEKMKTREGREEYARETMKPFQAMLDDPKTRIGGCYMEGNKKAYLSTGMDKTGHQGPAEFRMEVGGKQASQTGVYAHELTHAVDGPGKEHSRTSMWQSAWKEEIAPSGSSKEHRLNSYASSQPSEGFAEFGRLVYGGQADHKEVERRFPKATKYFKDHGLWPEGK
jgi:hypothetical protein